MEGLSEQIREKIGATHHKIVINRVPKNTFEKFMELASEDEFSQDYGMLLREMVNLYLDFKDLRNIATIETIAGLSDEVGLLRQEINELKKPKLEEEKKIEVKVRKSLDGKVINSYVNDGTER